MGGFIPGGNLIQSWQIEYVEIPKFVEAVFLFCCALLKKKKEKALGKSIDPGVEGFSSNCCVSLEAQDASEYNININPSPAICTQSLRSNMLRNSISVSMHTSASDCVLSLSGSNLHGFSSVTA